MKRGDRRCGSGARSAVSPYARRALPGACAAVCWSVALGQPLPPGEPAAGEDPAVASGAQPHRGAAAGLPADGPDAAGPGADADADAGVPPTGERPSNPLARLPLIGRFFRGGDDAASADGTLVAPHYALEVDAPDPVARQIREFTLLGRWRRRPGFDPSQLPLFVRRAEGEVRELLAAEGWFSPEIRIETIPGGVRIAVAPGPRARVADARVVVEGEAAGEAYTDVRTRVERGWLLQEGEYFRSPQWERAKSELLGALRDAGFLRARIEDSEALVQRDEASATLRVTVDSGPRLLFGGLEVGGLQRYPVSAVEGLAPFRPGEPYEVGRIVQYQTLLNGSGWFTTVNVRPDTQALERDPGLEQVPVRVDVVEREAKLWRLGGGYDTDRGFSVLAGWEHRNVAGLGIQTFNGIELDVERQVAYTTWETPQDRDGYRWQFGARAEHRDVQNDLTDAASVFGSRLRRRGDIETALSLQYQAERQNVMFGPDEPLVYDNRALVLGYTWTQRRLDSPIFPTRGYIVTGQVSGASRSLASERSFVRLYGLALGMVPLENASGEEFGRIAVRGEVGSVFAGAREGIPSANLFRTGGTKSVRGYAAQSLGVPLGDAIVGGRYLAVASVEYQHVVTRDVALAAFFDHGNASDSRDALQPVSGYGVGVRWRTPVGPLNLDLAWGEAVREWRLHFSIGVVF